MENLWVVSMGRQFFCMSTVGPPNKNPCMSTSKNKDINNKSKQNYPAKLSNANDAIEASTLFKQQQEVVESQQIQPTGEQLSINVLVKLGGIMYVNTVPCIFYNVHTCKFVLIKIIFVVSRTSSDEYKMNSLYIMYMTNHFDIILRLQSTKKHSLSGAGFVFLEEEIISLASE